MDEVMQPRGAVEEGDGPLANERKLLATAKKLSLFAAGSASQKHMQDLPDQQEIMAALADCIAEVYALESALLRAEKLIARQSEAAAANAIAMTRLYASKAMQTVEASARKVIAAVAEGDMLRTQMAILRRLTKYEPADTIGLGRQIARQVIDAGRYVV
jgi:alkylation response protein AidB-like acyl-CoA dehydrogenase